MARALFTLLLILAAGGCSITERLRHRVVIDEDTLDHAIGYPPPAPGNPWPIGVEATGTGDAEELLRAIVETLDEHPGIDLRRAEVNGVPVWLEEERPAAPPPITVRLGCTCEVEGTWTNALVAFPGMIWFFPIWLGYAWELDLELRAELEIDDAVSEVTRHARVRFREQNAPRSATFHLWPSHGFYGTQFVIGIVMAPFMCCYDGEETTPLLVEELQPRLGRTAAAELYREITHRLTPRGVDPVWRGP